MSLTLTKEQVSTLHHALRMLAKYPGMSASEIRATNAVADLIWEGIFCRYEELGRPTTFELTPRPLP